VRGLDGAGFVRREGHPGRVPSGFTALVRDYLGTTREAFGARGLDGVYLYGSIPRGTAHPRSSDLDGQLLLDREPTEADHELLRGLSAELAARHPEVCGVEVLLHSRARMTDPLLRYDEGFHIRVLCTPFWGRDAGEQVAPHRPDLELARHVQGDWRGALHRLRLTSARLAQGPPDAAEAVRHRRAVGRRLARLAFTWVMPRWGGWTSDPRVILEVVGELEPAWRASVARAVDLGWRTSGTTGDPRQHDPAATAALLDGFAETLRRRGEELGA
jgi:uncharacterized protein